MIPPQTCFLCDKRRNVSCYSFLFLNEIEGSWLEKDTPTKYHKSSSSFISFDSEVFKLQQKNQKSYFMESSDNGSVPVWIKEPSPALDLLNSSWFLTRHPPFHCFTWTINQKSFTKLKFGWSWAMSRCWRIFNGFTQLHNVLFSAALLLRLSCIVLFLHEKPVWVDFLCAPSEHKHNWFHYCALCLLATKRFAIFINLLLETQKQSRFGARSHQPFWVADCLFRGRLFLGALFHVASHTSRSDERWRSSSLDSRNFLFSFRRRKDA